MGLSGLRIGRIIEEVNAGRISPEDQMKLKIRSTQSTECSERPLKREALILSSPRAVDFDLRIAFTSSVDVKGRLSFSLSSAP